MRFTRVTIAAALALALMGAVAPQTALAHAELMSSSPAAGETLTAPPDEVIIEFDGELLPDGTGFTVTDPGGGTAGEGQLDLTIADSTLAPILVVVAVLIGVRRLRRAES